MPPNLRWIILWLCAIGVFFPLAVYVLLTGSPFHWTPLAGPDAQTIGFVVLATASLTILLTSMAVIFQQLGLSDSRQALGLPQGSVRALIALFLLTMFVIVTVHMFEHVTQFNSVKLAGVTAADKDKLTNVLRVAPAANGTFDVWVREQNDAAERFMQQVFTAILTLVTAVSSFYFGSRTAEPSRAPTNGTLAVTAIVPSRGSGKVRITNLSGSGFIGGAEVRLKQEGQPDVLADQVVVASDSRITCTIDMSSAQSGKWDVVVINPDGTQAQLKDGFEVQSVSLPPEASKPPSSTG